MTKQHINPWKSRAFLIALFLLFFLPTVVAWYLVFYTDYMRDRVGVHHGTLIDPPRLQADAEVFDPLSGKNGKLHGKWTLLVIVIGDCDQACMNNLYRMRQLHLAMGKDMYRLQRTAWFMDKTLQARAVKLFAEYAGQSFLSSAASNDDFLSRFMINDKLDDHAIYLIDPAGFLMMLYPAETDPSGIIKDLKRLLRISKMD